MIQDFIDTVGAWVTGFISWLGDLFEGIAGLIYGAEGFTFIGLLMLFGLAVGLVYFGINFVTRLVKK